MLFFCFFEVEICILLEKSGTVFAAGRGRNRKEPNRKMSKRVFTMIELLVVIAVVAILVSILLPLIGHARQRADEIVCSGNLRQIGIAHLLYSTEWDSTPPVYTSGSRWVDLLEPFLAAAQEDASKNIWVCPGDGRSDAVKVVFGGKDNSSLSYGINQCYSPGHGNSRANKLWYGVKPSIIRNPAEFIIVADAGAYYIGATIAPPALGILNGENAVIDGYCKYVAFRHGKKKRCNMVLGDGHVAALPFASIPERYWDLENDGSGYCQ